MTPATNKEDLSPNKHIIKDDTDILALKSFLNLKNDDVYFFLCETKKVTQRRLLRQLSNIVLETETKEPILFTKNRYGFIDIPQTTDNNSHKRE